MTSESYECERKSLLNRLLDAVKQCQVRFGGKKELATDADSRVVCLCNYWEAVLQHGIKHTGAGGKALSTLKQVTEKAGLANIPGVSDIKNLETEPEFFHYVKEILNKHEQQRFFMLKHITTDAGRGRAWLRASLNENSLERYMHCVIANETLLSQYYENWAFLRDMEKSSVLPNMAAGLGSILFAIAIDLEGLNTIRPAQGLDGQFSFSRLGEIEPDEDAKPVVVAVEPLLLEKKKEKKKRRKPAKLVSFDGVEPVCGRSSPTRVSTPPAPPAPNKQSFIPSNSDNSYRNDELNINSALTADGIAADESRIRTAADESRITTAVDESLSGITGQCADSISISSSSASVTSAVNDEQESCIYDIKTINSSQHEQETIDNMTIMTSQRDTSPYADVNNMTSTTSNQCSSDYNMTTTAFSTPPSTLPLTRNNINCDTDIYSNQSRSAPVSDTPVTLTPMTPIGGDDEGLMIYPASSNGNTSDTASIDSYNIPSCPYTESAAHALQLAQLGLSDNIPALRTAGDGSNDPESPSGKETMSTSELKQAVVAMMLRKDDVEEENRQLRALCEVEQETSAGLKAELEEIRKSHHITIEKDQSRIQALTRENELLKHQLKKYVNAVQLLRREGLAAEGKIGVHLDDIQPAIPASKPQIDYSHEASEYEKKLIQVAEMHGELIEFNESLHKQLLSKESQLRRLRQDLIELRGPLPNHHEEHTDDNTSISSDADVLSPTSRPLINIWIPSAFMRGVGTESHHVYQSQRFQTVVH
ncbi:sorting nexin-29-like isoform X2 [Tubulanus polymorphus]|uniref:sorting nexin-29-like isoform X2 n=1 Tax=Tubulanus polymorphus TaxID=672921 RepID=UPI003DA54963